MGLGNSHFYLRLGLTHLKSMKRKRNWGGDKDSCEKCEIRKERNTETLDHVLIECPEYKSERLNFETEVKRTIGDREWETIKQGEDKGMKEILGLGDCGRKMTDITKKYLATIWRKRKLNKKGQENNRAENKNVKNLETVKHGDHSYHKV